MSGVSVRRLLATGLLGAGVALLGVLVWHAPDDPRRSGVLVVIAVGGVGLNLIAVARRHLLVRAWLRNLLCVLGAVLLASLLGLSHYIRVSVLPTVPESDPVLRLALSSWQSTVSWLSVAVGYFVLSVAVLPGPPGSVGDQEGRLGSGNVRASENAPKGG